LIDSQERTILTTFFNQRIVPLSADLTIKDSRDSRREHRESFFVKRHSPSITAAEFELNLKDRDTFARELEQYWKDRPLAPIAQELVTLGTRFEQLDEKADVSQFVYEMF